MAVNYAVAEFGPDVRSQVPMLMRFKWRNDCVIANVLRAHAQYYYQPLPLHCLVTTKSRVGGAGHAPVCFVGEARTRPAH